MTTTSDRPKLVRTSIVLEAEQAKKLERIAQEQERSISWLIRKAIDETYNKSLPVSEQVAA